MMHDEIRLVTRADDLGSFASANQAILHAHQKGILKNASVMVCCEHFAAAAEMFRGEKNICLGLHAMITAEWENVRWKPLLPPERVPHLINSDGTFRRSTMEIHGTGFAPDEIITELQAQLDRARQAGLNIEYLDEHMAFYWLHPDPDDAAKRMDEYLHAWAEREGLIHVRHNEQDRIEAVSPLTETDENAAVLIRHFQRMKKGNTYFCITHPAYDDEEMRTVYNPTIPLGTVATQREWDRQVFTHPAILAHIKENAIRPIRYTEII